MNSTRNSTISPVLFQLNDSDNDLDANLEFQLDESSQQFDGGYATQPAFILGLDSQLSWRVDETPNLEESQPQPPAVVYPALALDSSQKTNNSSFQKFAIPSSSRDDQAFSNFESQPTLSQAGTKNKLSKTQTRKCKTKKKNNCQVFYHCKLDGCLYQIAKRDFAIIEVLGNSLSSIQEKVHKKNKEPLNIRSLNLQLYQIETILNRLGDDKLEQVLPVELWDEMIHNMYATFHETQSLVELCKDGIEFEFDNLTQSFTQNLSLKANGNLVTAEVEETISSSSVLDQMKQSQNPRSKKKQCQKEKAPPKKVSAKRAESESNTQPNEMVDRQYSEPIFNMSLTGGIESQNDHPFAGTQLNLMETVPHQFSDPNLNEETDLQNDSPWESGKSDETVRANREKNADLPATNSNAQPGQPDNNISLEESTPHNPVTVPEEPCIIFETQGFVTEATQVVELQSQQEMITQTQLNNIGLDLYKNVCKITLCRFSLKPFLKNGVLHPGKNNMKLGLMNSIYTGSLREDGSIEMNGFVFKTIGYWIKSVTGKYCSQLPLETKQTLMIRYDGNCLYQTLHPEITQAQAPKRKSTEKHEERCRKKRNNVELNNNIATALSQMEITPSQSTSSRNENVGARIQDHGQDQPPPASFQENSSQTQVAKSGRIPVKKSIKSSQVPIDKSSQIPAVMSSQIRVPIEACSTQPSPNAATIEDDILQPLVPNLNQRKQPIQMELVPDMMTRHLTSVIIHAPSEYYRTCQCIESFWNKGNFPSHLLEEVDHW